MLKPIHALNCRPAIAACQQLMQGFALWLCDANIRGADVTHANLQARMGSKIEGDWLWLLVAGTTGKKKLLSSAEAIANLPLQQKQGLAQWVQAASRVAQHFSATPPADLPVEPPKGWGARSDHWRKFHALMAAFYEEGLKNGLPYQSDGMPTDVDARRVNYDQLKREFRQAHRLDPHPDAREVCVLCGGPLSLPAVDHWIAKAHFPLLAVCADNLLPICSECNQAPQKGQKPVHTNGNFSDWFHPYLRHANGAVTLRYIDGLLGVRAQSATAEHSQKVEHLDDLLNLSERWTREFRAEYRRLQRELEQRHKRTPLTEPYLQERMITHKSEI